MTTASMGHQAKLATDPSSSTVTQPFEYQSCTIGKKATILDTAGIRGTRSHQSDRSRAGVYVVSGQLVMQPTHADLAIWLPRILGAAPSGTTYALAETLPTFYLVEDRVAKVFTYSGCKVNRAVFSGSQGGFLTLTMDIEGLTESVGNAGTFPSLSLTDAGPYIFSDLTLTLQSASREVKDFELTIDNQLVTDRFMNNTTRVNLPEGDRIITLRTTHAYASGNTDLYAQALAGAAGTLALAANTKTSSWAFAALQVPDNAPVVQGKGEIPLVLQMIARMTSTTKELIVTHSA